MPRGDGTGPWGLGPMTGRAAGYCAGYPVPGFMNPFGGRGFGWWRPGFGGRGRGWRFRYYATGVPGWMAFGYPAVPYARPVYPVPYGPAIPREQEVAALQEQAQFLQDQLEEINNRLKELEAEKRSESDEK